MSACNWTLPETEQEIFNTVVSGLLRQGRRSTGTPDPEKPGSLPPCRYRGIDGCKCAAGFLIPDEHYKPGFEGNSWRVLVLEGKTPAQHLHLILQLQHIHDWKEPPEWRKAFIDLANRLRLDDSCIETAVQEQSRR